MTVRWSIDMINVKSFVFSCLSVCQFVCADYICVENVADVSLVFRLHDAHYDVYKYQFLPEEGGLGNRSIVESGSEIVLNPNQKIMLRTMYSYNKSGGRSSLELIDKTDTVVFSDELESRDKAGSIVFSDELYNFKLSGSLEVKVLSQLDVFDDDFSGLADKVYRITKSTSAPSTPKKSTKIPRSLSGTSLNKRKE